MELVRQKNVATVIVFPIVDADGDLVNNADDTTPDSEYSYWSDGSTPSAWADCTNEFVEIGTSGLYYLSLAQAEMNYDYIAIQAKTGVSGAKTQVILIRTMVGDPANLATNTSGREAAVSASGVINADAVAISTDTTAADNLELMFDGTGYAGGTTKLGVDIISISGDTTAADNAELAFDGTGYAFTGCTLPWNTSWDAEVESEVSDALIDNNLDHLCKTATAAADMTTEIADNTILSRILASGDTSVFDPTTDSLQDIRDAIPAAAPTAADNADAVWDEARSGHTGDGTFGQGVASVIGNVGGNVTGNVGGNVTGSVGSLATQAKADVNAEVLDVMNVDTIVELTQGIPPSTPTPLQAIMLMYMKLRNEQTTTSSWLNIKNDAGTIICKASLADASSILTKGKLQSGA